MSYEDPFAEWETEMGHDPLAGMHVAPNLDNPHFLDTDITVPHAAFIRDVLTNPDVMQPMHISAEDYYTVFGVAHSGLHGIARRFYQDPGPVAAFSSGIAAVECTTGFLQPNGGYDDEISLEIVHSYLATLFDRFSTLGPTYFEGYCDSEIKKRYEATPVVSALFFKIVEAYASDTSSVPYGIAGAVLFAELKSMIDHENPLAA